LGFGTFWFWAPPAWLAANSPSDCCAMAASANKDITRMTLQDVVARHKPANASIPISIVTSDFADPETAATASGASARCNLQSRRDRLRRAEAEFDKAIASISTARAILIDAIRARRRRLRAAAGVTLDRRVRRAVPGKIGDEFFHTPLTATVPRSRSANC